MGGKQVVTRYKRNRPIIWIAESKHINIIVEAVKAEMADGNYTNTFVKVDYDFPMEGDARKAGYASYPFFLSQNIGSQYKK